MTEPYNDPYTQMEAKAMSMTDEERARKLARQLWRYDRVDQTSIEETLVAAFAAVREECAKVAESKHVNCPGTDYQQRAYNRACHAIAQAIRTGP